MQPNWYNFRTSTYDKSTGSVKVSSLAGSLGAVSIFDRIFTLGNDNLNIDDNVADLVQEKLVKPQSNSRNMRFLKRV